MDSELPSRSTHLTWINVGFAFAFILANALASRTLGLGVEFSLLIAALRCVGQLALVAGILKGVFETESPWLVAFVAFLLNFLGTFETVVNKSKMRYRHMFFSVLIGMLGSTIPVSILGVRFAMSLDKFWTPSQYIPIVGMLCGSTISGMVVSINYVLNELYNNRDKIETYLAFGATRLEACKPIAKQAIRLALTPTINQMSVIGIIAIPGMMTGAILGGSSVDQASKLQMIIMFMISSSTALASMSTAVHAVLTVVDSQHRIRIDRVHTQSLHAFLLERIGGVRAALRGLWSKRQGRGSTVGGRRGGEETELLLSPTSPMGSARHPFSSR